MTLPPGVVDIRGDLDEWIETFSAGDDGKPWSDPLVADGWEEFRGFTPILVMAAIVANALGFDVFLRMFEEAVDRGLVAVIDHGSRSFLIMPSNFRMKENRRFQLIFKEMD